MSREQDLRFMALAQEVGLLSEDRSRKVGAVIVGGGGEFIVSGHNRFPKGVRTDIESRHARPDKYLWTEHAERNAVYEAARLGLALNGSTMYLPWFPCVDCARAIVQAGIVRLVAYRPDGTDPTWGSQFPVALELLEESGVSVDFVDKD